MENTLLNSAVCVYTVQCMSWCLIASIHLYQVITASVRFVVISKFMSAVVCIQLLVCAVYLLYIESCSNERTNERVSMDGVWKYAIYGRTWAINIYRQHDRLHSFSTQKDEKQPSHMRRFDCIFLCLFSICTLWRSEETKETGERLVFLERCQGGNDVGHRERYRGAYTNGNSIYNTLNSISRKIHLRNKRVKRNGPAFD